MKLNKGEKIKAAVMAAEGLAKTHYQVEIVEILQQSENFNVYLGEDDIGNHVCLKAIRYRNEKKESFDNLGDYIDYRRAGLITEHKLLALDHPYLPEPIAMLIVNNNSAEDQKLFRKTPNWQNLSQEEPILVEEYFSGHNLVQLSDKLRLFSLKRRLGILKKVAKMCLYMQKNGYLTQNLHPSNIILKPSHDDNIYLIGLHNVYRRGNGKKTGSVDFARGYAPPEAINHGHNYDERVDVYQLGMLLYYMITLHDPAKDLSWWKKSSDYFCATDEKYRIKKSVDSLDKSNDWVVDLILNLLEPEPEKRLPDIETLLQYLKYPPADSIKLKIKSVQRKETILKIGKIPAWCTQLEIRMEIAGNTKIFHRTFPCKRSLQLPGASSGKIICSVAGSNEKGKKTWWHHCQVEVSPDIEYKVIESLALDQFGLTWFADPELEKISIIVARANGEKISMGDFDGNEAILPSEGTSLPYYEKLKVECSSYFRGPGGSTPGRKFQRVICLFPPIPQPLYREISQGIQLEMLITSAQADAFADIEILQNDWPCKINKQEKQKVSTTQYRYIFVIDTGKINFLDKQKFEFRALIDEVGWRTGPPLIINVPPPAVTNLQISELKPGCIEASWSPISHPQLQGYQIQCDGQVPVRSRMSVVSIPLPLKDIVKQERSHVMVSICAVYGEGEIENISAPSEVRYDIGQWQDWLGHTTQQQITPLYTRFVVKVQNPQALSGLTEKVIFRRRHNNQEWEVSTLDVQEEYLLHDDKIEVGEQYSYQLILEDIDITFFEKEVTIPSFNAEVNFQGAGYENCFWEIFIDLPSAACIARELEIKREGTPSRQVSFVWPQGEEFYFFDDQQLIPGNSYRYTLTIPLRDQQPQVIEMGEVSTRQFQIKEDIQLGYNHAVISWTPSPAGHIDCIELYDENNSAIGSTQSDSITLENLEPERTYTFPLKYRYLSGLVTEGKKLSFTTKEYDASVKVVDVDAHSFRLRWDVADMSLKGKMQEYVLEVEENVGTHRLKPKVKSVQLRNLFSCTTYRWHLKAKFKSGSLCTLAKGEAVTHKPELTIHVEVGLIHHLWWEYARSPGIENIEVYRDDTLLLETSGKEMYDSDFKGGHEVTYRFYYVMKDKRRVPAGEKTVKTLSMSELFSALKIDTGLGCINWQFDDLKKFKYLKYVELWQGNQSLYKKGKHQEMSFVDRGKQEEQGEEFIGLQGDPMNFQLDVVGVAPIARKCKKKWVLNIKGLHCEYPKFPTGFKVIREHSCIYFEWDYTESNLLQEITLWRAEDDEILYQGPNEPCIVFDDNQEKGLNAENPQYYYLKLDYKNYDAPPESCNDYYEELNTAFDPEKLDERLGIIAQQTGDHLRLSWDGDMETSISHIKCQISHGVLGKISLFSKLFGFTGWSDFGSGELLLPITPGQKFYYQLIYQDFYGCRFSSSAKSSHNIPFAY